MSEVTQSNNEEEEKMFVIYGTLPTLQMPFFLLEKYDRAQDFGSTPFLRTFSVLSSCCRKLPLCCSSIPGAPIGQNRAVWVAPGGRQGMAAPI